MERFGTWRLSAAVAFCFTVVAPSAAEARIDVRTLACGDAKSLVWQSGAIVLTTGRHTYDRFVVNERLCPPGHMTRPAYVQTRDAQACEIGYICVLDTEREDRRWWLRVR